VVRPARLGQGTDQGFQGRGRPAPIAGWRDPGRVFGFFAIAAGMDVFGIRLAAAGHPLVTAILAGVLAAVWLGLVLYLLLVSLILLHWLTVPMTPQTLSPPYWILMGATAIIVLAGARILGLPAAPPAVRATAGFVEGSSFALWAFGTWWIPLLVVLGIWRHVRHHWPLTYEPTLWSVVFPLGMYSVATLTFGQVAQLAFMEPLSRFMLWAALAAWIAVAAALGARVRLAAWVGEKVS